MGYDSGEFRPSMDFRDSNIPCVQSEYGCEWIRVYEAKLFHQYDHRFGTYPLSEYPKCEERPASQRGANCYSAPRFWAELLELKRRLSNIGWDRPYLLGYRDIARATDERTCIACVLPEVAPDDTIRLLFVKHGSSRLHSALIANLNSFVLDYAARNTVASTHLSEYLAKQLPVLNPLVYSQASPVFGQATVDWIAERVLELTYTAWDLRPFARSCGYSGPPFRWDEERRFLLRCELDAAYFHLYGITDDDVAYIMDTFPIVKRKDKAAHGEYRTKRHVLELYDAMAEATHTGVPFQSPLNPPPGRPAVLPLATR